MSKKPCLREPLGKQDGKCVKTLLQSEWLHLYTVAMWMTALSEYILITEKVVALEEVSFSYTQNPKSVC